MMSNLLIADQRHKISHFLFLGGLMIIAIGLPLSKFLMSIGQLIIAFAWLLDGNFKVKFKRFFNTPSAYLISGIYVLLCIGLLYTSNFSYASNDLRVKAPLLIFPLICVSMSSLRKIDLHRISYVFIAAVAIGIMASIYVYITTSALSGISNRNLSIFISHIRFSLMVCMAIFFTLNYAFNHKRKWIWILISLAFIFYLFFAGMTTGVVILFCISIFYCIYLLFSKVPIQKKVISVATLILLIIVPFLYIQQNVNDFKRFHKEIDLTAENIQWEKLGIAWNKRSDLNFNGKDLKEQQLSTTLIRYLTSKDLSIDKEGITALSNNDITAIENGVANAKMLDYGLLKKRVQQGIFAFHEYLESGYSNGHTLLLHYIYQKTGIQIFSEHWVIGVGTGDINDTFQAYYKSTNSNLSPEYRLRSHNQYITIGIAIGILGLLSFLFALIYPLLMKDKRKNLLFVCFLIMMMLSMLSEDTLETQAGVTLFIFFEAYFLWLLPEEKEV